MQGYYVGRSRAG